MTGFLGGEYANVQFYVWFSLLGLIQSICFPAFVHIVANWFSQKNRGIAVGSFCSCVNIGDIIGAQLGQALLRAFDQKWQWLFVLNAVIFLTIALLNYIFLVQHPEHIGIIIDEVEVSKQVSIKMLRLTHSKSVGENERVNILAISK